MPSRTLYATQPWRASLPSPGPGHFRHTPAETACPPQGRAPSGAPLQSWPALPSAGPLLPDLPSSPISRRASLLSPGTLLLDSLQSWPALPRERPLPPAPVMLAWPSCYSSQRNLFVLPSGQGRAVPAISYVQTCLYLLAPFSCCSVLVLQGLGLQPACGRCCVFWVSCSA